MLRFISIPTIKLNTYAKFDDGGKDELVTEYLDGGEVQINAYNIVSIHASSDPKIETVVRMTNGDVHYTPTFVEALIELTNRI